MGPHISRKVLHFPGVSQYLNFQSQIGWFWASCVDYQEKKKVDTFFAMETIAYRIKVKQWSWPYKQALK